MLVNSTLLPLFELTSAFVVATTPDSFSFLGARGTRSFRFRWRGIILGLMKANELAIVLRAA